MDTLTNIIEQNLRSVQQRIAAACARAGRDSSSVQLVAVTKYAELEWVRALVKLGERDLGESRPQQLVARARHLDSDVRWHLIGHLQRNKVKLVLPAVTWIHSVDSLRLLHTIEQTAAQLELQPQVLLEVNLTGEPQRTGFARDALLAQWDEVLQCRRVRVQGLMGMAAQFDLSEDARPTFAALRTLRDELRQRSPADWTLPELSMGMTGDFEAAIAEGATIVRIGSALWHGLPSGESASEV